MVEKEASRGTPYKAVSAFSPTCLTLIFTIYVIYKNIQPPSTHGQLHA